MYYNTETLKQSKRKNIMVYLTLEQKRIVVHLVNEAGLYLFDFYLSKANVPSYEYTDAKTAKAVGWTERKVAEYRRKLEAVDLFKQETYGTGENKAIITIVGNLFIKNKRKDRKDEEVELVVPDKVQSSDDED